MTDMETIRTDLDALRDDLAYMKSVARDDGRPHWLIGAHFLAAGVLYGAPLFPVWAILKGYLDLPTGWTSWVSIYSTLIYVPIAIWLSLMARGLKFMPSANTSRAFAALWGTIGLSTLFIVFCIFFAGARMHVDWMWQVWCAVCFALYGGAWLGVSIIRRDRRWALVALGSYANAVVNALLIGRGHDILLGVGSGLLLWLALPGAVMMWRNRVPA